MLQRWSAKAFFLAGWGYSMHNEDEDAAAGADRPEAILLVAFGTSVREAEVAYRETERLCRRRFPGRRVRWAFTARMIRAKLAAAGRPVDSPAEALARLAAEGHTRLAVQSLHVIRGQEYDEMRAEIESACAARGGLPRVRVGLPLLSSVGDLERVADLMTDSLVPPERRPGEAVVWMGHGSNHHAEDAKYAALAEALRQRDARTFLGTVEGNLAWDGVAEAVRRSGARTAWLLPFMAVAGDHARNDLAGEEEDSWKSILESAGVRCFPVLKGIAEYPVMTEVWMDHLAEACCAGAPAAAVPA